MIPQQIESKHLTKYTQYFQYHALDEQQPLLSPDTMRRYRIEMRHPTDVPLSELRLTYELAYEGYGGKIASYVVDVGRYRLSIYLLNLPGDIPIQESAVVGEGAFGTVLSKYVVGQEFVAKVCWIKKSSAHEGLMDLLEEVAITKLCAAFEIGPGMETRIPFDLIMYDDAIQFHLEKCQSVWQGVREFDTADYFGEDLKKRLRRLHALHIVHRDIKPLNILWSPTLRGFVFCDFGISCYVKQEIGSLSMSGRCGTKQYMSLGMSVIGEDGGKVDLYYNDVYALERSVNEIIENLRSSRSQSQSGDMQSRQEIKGKFSTSKVSVPASNQQNTSGSAFLQIQVSNRIPSSEPSQTQVFLISDAYEFYRLVFASVSLDDHDFNFKENLPKLTPEQCLFIHDILANSLNKPKMENIIQELRSIKPEEGSMQKDWLEEFENNFTTNFDNHVPRFSQPPTVAKEWVTNLKRLLGRNKALDQIELDLLRPVGVQDNQRMFKKIVQQIGKKRQEKLLTWRDEILKFSSFYCKEQSIEEEELKLVCRCLLLNISHRSKELLLKDLMSIFLNPKEVTNMHFLEHLAAILKKEEQTFQIFFYVQAESSLERCIALLPLHYQLVEDKSSIYLLKICDVLLQRLSNLPVEICCIETINVKRIHLLVRESRLELDHVAVRKHFEECRQLLVNCHSHQDAFSVLRVLEQRLQFFQWFELPLADERLAHVELEQYRQFYSEIVDLDANVFAGNTYRDQGLVASASVTGNELDSEYMRLFQRQRQLSKQGLIRQASQVHLQLEAIQVQRLNSSATPDQRDIEDVINDAHLQYRMGRPREADELLQSVNSRVLKSTKLIHHREYYHVRSQVDFALGRYSAALSNCKRAIEFNERLGGSNFQNDRAYKLRQLLAGIYCSLGQYQTGGKMLQELREALLQAELPDYEKLYVNISTTAEHLRSAGRLQQSAAMCRKVFELERKGLIPPHQSAFVHGIMARIAGEQKRPGQQLLQSWKVLEKTLNIGKDSECVAYTCIMKQYRQMVGNEVLSLISYARKFTDPPRQGLRGIIAEELFLNPVPTGQLPLDMPTSDFIRFTQSRLRNIPVAQHLACYFFKWHIAENVMPSKFEQWPEFKLLYVRTLLEAQLHRFVAGKAKELLQSLPQTIEMMRKCQVAETDYDNKRLLVEYAESILERSISKSENILRQLPESIEKRIFKSRNSREE